MTKQQKLEIVRLVKRLADTEMDLRALQVKMLRMSVHIDAAFDLVRFKINNERYSVTECDVAEQQLNENLIWLKREIKKFI